MKLKDIKKFFNTAKAETNGVPEMTTQEAQPELAVNINMAELTAQLATANEALSAQAAAFAELTTKFEAIQAALDASEDAKKLLATQAATARLEARTAAITKAVGTSQLTSLLAATDSMDDAQFDVVVGAFAKSFETEAKSAMFKEVGVSAAAEAPEEDAVKRLAAKMAAQFQTK